MVLFIIGCIIRISTLKWAKKTDSYWILITISVINNSYYLLICAMFLITLFNYLVIKILGSPKKNIKIEKNLKQDTLKQSLLILKQADEK